MISRTRRHAGLVPPMLAAVAPLIVLAARILIEHPHIFFWGDQALGDIAAGRAVTGRELLGPYSRYGWHHPGPVWFVMIGIVRGLGFGSPMFTVIGVLAVHALFAVLLVVVGERLAGRVGAWVAAVAALAVLQTLGLVERVAYLWNPWAITLPALLLIGLSVLLADRTRPAVPLAIALLLCGSFLVQTHAGTLVFVVLVPAAGLALRVSDVLIPPWQRGMHEDDGYGRPPPPQLDRRSRTLVVAGAIALVLIWIPPVAQQLTREPGNLGQLASYMRATHEKSTLGVASVAVGTELRAFPFLKDTPHLYQESDAGVFAGSPRRRLLPYAYLAAAVLLCLLAVRRGKVLAATCAAIGGVGIAAALLTTVLASPPLYPYLVAWMCALPVPIWAAGLALVGPRLARQVAIAGFAGMVAAFAVSGVCAYQAVHDEQLKEHLAFPGGEESWRLVRTRVLSQHGPVLLYLADGGTMPVAAAIADQAYRKGRSFHVNRAFQFMFGDAARSHGGESLELYFAGVDQSGDDPPPTGALDLGVVRATRVYAVYR